MKSSVRKVRNVAIFCRKLQAKRQEERGSFCKFEEEESTGKVGKYFTGDLGNMRGKDEGQLHRRLQEAKGSRLLRDRRRKRSGNVEGGRGFMRGRVKGTVRGSSMEEEEA